MKHSFVNFVAPKKPSIINYLNLPADGQRDQGRHWDQERDPEEEVHPRVEGSEEDGGLHLLRRRHPGKLPFQSWVGLSGIHLLPHPRRIKPRPDAASQWTCP